MKYRLLASLLCFKFIHIPNAVKRALRYSEIFMNYTRGKILLDFSLVFKVVIDANKFKAKKRWMRDRILDYWHTVHSLIVATVPTKQALEVLSRREWYYLSDLHRKYFPSVLLLNKNCSNHFMIYAPFFNDLSRHLVVLFCDQRFFDVYNCGLFV